MLEYADGSFSEVSVSQKAPLSVSPSAFDMVHDPAVALEALISLGFERILTSGCDSSALEGLPVIKRLVEQVRHRLLDVQQTTEFNAVYVLYLHK